MLFASLSWGHSTDYLSAIFDGLLWMESSLLSGEPLADDFRLLSELQVLPGRFVAGIPHTECKTIWLEWK